MMSSEKSDESTRKRRREENEEKEEKEKEEKEENLWKRVLRQHWLATTYRGPLIVEGETEEDALINCFKLKQIQHSFNFWWWCLFLNGKALDCANRRRLRTDFQTFYKEFDNSIVRHPGLGPIAAWAVEPLKNAHLLEEFMEKVPREEIVGVMTLFFSDPLVSFGSVQSILEASEYVGESQ
jgi:hypothetical protein